MADWTETKVLYTEMADTFSGGFAYAYGETGVNACMTSADLHSCRSFFLVAFFNSDGKVQVCRADGRVHMGGWCMCMRSCVGW